MALPVEAVAKDAALERLSAKASEELARHRWYWTLDESNQARVSIREYARQVGRDFRTIHKYANGYVRRMADAELGISDAIERAALSAEREAAVQAVAAAKGIAFSTAATKGQYRKEATEVLHTARDRAERKGTSVTDEMVAVAHTRQKARTAAQKQTAARKERLGLRYIEMEGHLAHVKRRLVEALTLARDIDFGTDETELLADTLGNIKALLELIDLALVGTANVDWDAELATITKEVER